MVALLEKISDFFTWVVDTVKALIEFVWTIIDGTLQLLGLIPEATKTLTTSITHLPPILLGFAGATITVSVIFLIVGRNSGGSK